MSSCYNHRRKLEGPTFLQRTEIKPWLQKRLAPLGIAAVIERSDESKIVFKCKHRHPTHGGHLLGQGKLRHTRIRIRSNYSIRLRLWTLVLVSEKTDDTVVEIVAAALERKEKNESSQDAPTRTTLLPPLDSLRLPLPLPLPFSHHSHHHYHFSHRLPSPSPLPSEAASSGPSSGALPQSLPQSLQRSLPLPRLLATPSPVVLPSLRL